MASFRDKFVFFKNRDQVRKVPITFSTLEDLKTSFLENLPTIYTVESMPPLWIKDKETKIKFELESIDDIYPNCVIELRSNKLDQMEKRDSRFGYYLWQRRKLIFVMVGLPARGKSYVAR